MLNGRLSEMTSRLSHNRQCLPRRPDFRNQNRSLRVEKAIHALGRRHATDRLVDETDIVVIGSGMGGLSCGALLAKYGYSVSVLEAHSIPGGCAHGWSRGDCHFDSGTSLFFGISNRDLDNPLTSVLALLDEDIEMLPYGQKKTRLFWEDRVFNTQIGSAEFKSVVEDLWGTEARQEWTELQKICRDYDAVAGSIHPMAVRYDNWIGLTAVARSPLAFLKFLTADSKVSSADFSSIVNDAVHSEALKNFVNVLCQGTSGLASDDIVSSYMIRAFNRLYQPDAQWEIPLGGSQSIVDALVRGLRKFGGKLHLQTRAEEIAVENRNAVGVRLSGNRYISAKKAVVSNATIWDTARLISPELIDPDFKQYISEVELNASFLHLHLVFDKDGLPDMPLHSFFFDDSLIGDTGWPTICIPTSVDPSLAPAEKHILHAYLAEPYNIWEGMDTKSRAYREFKGQRTEVLWRLIKRVVPDIEERVSLTLAGSPLTHERFLNRLQGTYGSKNLLKIQTTPTGIQPLRNVYCVGDSTFPGTGTPAVAASAMWVANTLTPIHKHWHVLNQLNV